jgi:predicted transcriptional regulator
MARAEDAAVVAALRRAESQALFVTELQRQLGVDPESLDETLSTMASDGVVLIAGHGAPDPHLDGADLRVVALEGAPGLPTAQERGNTVWNRWLHTFLSAHRCQ